jgi:cold shock CspA family protein
VICATKESFGFISASEREKDIFFHFSEVPSEFLSEIKPGQEVSFYVVNDPKQDKQSAVKITFLPPGSVSFEVSTVLYHFNDLNKKNIFIFSQTTKF